ncbi:winged helix-turn-helix domain-containing protein [Pleurocapsales cyanobacterium LEGE 10410]|nr:winged helix-turn-helix domain-containing protein [Pleurocapsales cyanobacterium LEGE 10410]
MPKQLSLSQHLSTLELLDRYGNASSVIEKSHYQIIWLLSTGKAPKQVAEMTSYSQTWIYQLINRYNERGEEGLGDLRASNPGKEPLLNDVQQAQLHQVLTNPARDGGLWNGRKVAEWMSQITGKKISRMRGWEYLKQMEYSLKVPRPEHDEISLAEQPSWKKN